MITTEIVKTRVNHIKLNLHDNEACHGYEDNLWRSVLESIAEGAKNPKELAIEALKTQELDFHRWCS